MLFFIGFLIGYWVGYYYNTSKESDCKYEINNMNDPNNIARDVIKIVWQNGDVTEIEVEGVDLKDEI